MAAVAAACDGDSVVICRQVGQRLPSSGVGKPLLVARLRKVFQMLQSVPSSCESLQMCALNLMDKLLSQEDTTEVSDAKDLFVLVSTLPPCDTKVTMLLQIQKFIKSKME